MSKIYNSVLLDLKSVEGVKRLALADKDGFLLCENTSDESEVLTRMSAAMLKAAETVTVKLEKSTPDRVIVDFNGGKLITTSAGAKALISVMAAQDANLDPIINELEKTAWKIKAIL